MFVVCLDSEPKPLEGKSELDIQAMQCLHGGGSKSNSINRWFDKSVQVIFGNNGHKTGMFLTFVCTVKVSLENDSVICSLLLVQTGCVASILSTPL